MRKIVYIVTRSSSSTLVKPRARRRSVKCWRARVKQSKENVILSKGVCVWRGVGGSRQSEGAEQRCRNQMGLSSKRLEGGGGRLYSSIEHPPARRASNNPFNVFRERESAVHILYINERGGFACASRLGPSSAQPAVSCCIQNSTEREDIYCASSRTALEYLFTKAAIFKRSRTAHFSKHLRDFASASMANFATHVSMQNFNKVQKKYKEKLLLCFLSSGGCLRIMYIKGYYNPLNEIIRVY